MNSLEIPIHSVAQELVDPYYSARLELRRRAPSLPVIMLGRLTNRLAFSQPLNRRHQSCMWPRGIHADLGIEHDDENGIVTYAFPEALNQFEEAITLIAGHEHSAYPDATYESVTIESRQSVVEADTSQIQNEEFHRDALRGEWRHIYVVGDKQPTEFITFDDQTNEQFYDNGESDDVITADPYQVVYANSTTFHRSPKFIETSWRTFLRVTYIHNVNAGVAKTAIY